MPEQLVIASNNKGKISEFTQLLAPLSLVPVSQGELGVGEAEEPAVTFVGRCTRLSTRCAISLCPGVSPARCGSDTHYLPRPLARIDTQGAAR